MDVTAGYIVVVVSRDGRVVQERIAANHGNIGDRPLLVNFRAQEDRTLNSRSRWGIGRRNVSQQIGLRDVRTQVNRGVCWCRPS